MCVCERERAHGGLSCKPAVFFTLDLILMLLLVMFNSWRLQEKSGGGMGVGSILRVKVEK